MKEPYSRDYLGDKGPKINSIISVIQKFSSSDFFKGKENLVDVYSCIFGTYPKNSYDLLSIIHQFLFRVKRRYEEVKFNSEKITNPDEIIIRSMEHCGAVDIAKYVEKVNEEDKKLIAYSIKDDDDLCMKIVERLPAAYKKVVNLNPLKEKLWDTNPLLYFGVLLLDSTLNAHRAAERTAIDAGSWASTQVSSSVNDSVDEHVRYARRLVIEKLGLALNLEGCHDLVLHSLPEIRSTINEISGEEECTGDFLRMIEDNIYGMTPMRDTFRRIESMIVPIYRQYNTKIIMLLTDGESTDGSPIDFVPKFLEDTGTILVTCFFSRHDLRIPKTLFDTIPPNLTRYETDLFNMSSEITTDLIAFDVLKNEGWSVPSSGKCRLFVQVNNRKTVEEFIESVKKLFTSNDALLDLIGKVHMDKYVTSKKIDGFSTTRQVGGTCYAHAIATVIHLACSRVYGRKVEEFEEIKTKLIAEFGTDGANEITVFNKVLGRYRLHYEKVNEIGTREAIHSKRPCVAVFTLTNAQWWKFSKFFYDRIHRKEVLTRKYFDEMELTDDDILKNLKWEVKNNSKYLGRKAEELTEQERNNIAKQRGGHAVVLIRCGPRSLTFLNSWGTEFGEYGFFSVENADVLGVTFYDDAERFIR